MKYNPASHSDRVNLANQIVAMLNKSNFVKVVRPRTNEDVYSHPVTDTTHNGRISILVYTSIQSGEIRECGTDAIRVCAVYETLSGSERGIASAEKRVNRVGDISAIVERTYGRMREVYASAKTSSRCPSCNAPMFLSKSGRLCCADICWKK